MLSMAVITYHSQLLVRKQLLITENIFPFLCIPEAWAELRGSLVSELVLTVIKPISDTFNSLFVLLLSSTFYLNVLKTYAFNFNFHN